MYTQSFLRRVPALLTEARSQIGQLKNVGQSCNRTFVTTTPALSSQTNIQVIYKEIPTGLPVPDRAFEVKKSTIIPKDVNLKPDEILVRNIYLSVDPYMRGRMRDPKFKSYAPAAEIGKPFVGGAVGEVVKSNNSKYNEGDVVVAGLVGWESYTVLNTGQGSAGPISVIPNARNSPVPLSYYLGVLGMPGITAYTGLHKICEPLKSPDGKQQTLYVSAAAGAVGQVVGQYGKTLGLRVVGSAGDDAKVDYLLKDLNFDAAFNYKKHEDFRKILKETCPNGIDIYFENVGGKMLDAVLAQANDFARIAVCGMISQYNLAKPDPIYALAFVVSKRIRMQGFIVFDEGKKYGPEAIKTFSSLLKEGKLKYRESVTDGIENAPKAFVEMLQGKNFGKAVVKVADL